MYISINLYIVKAKVNKGADIYFLYPTQHWKKEENEYAQRKNCEYIKSISILEIVNH